MEFGVKGSNFEVYVSLDDENEALDLAESGIGERILDALAEDLVRHVEHSQTPDGNAWEKNTPSTVRRKGHGRVGYDKGATGLTDPASFLPGERVIEARYCSWTHSITTSEDGRRILEGWQLGIPGRPRTLVPGPFGAGESRGTPARPVVGWTPYAQQLASNLINDENQRMIFAEGE